MFLQVGAIMGISFIFQTAVNMYSDYSAEAENEKTPAQHARYNYEEAVAKQQAEGGPRRYYNDGELDIESARVTDENGNPIVSKSTEAAEYARDYVHVHMSYCIG